MTKTKSTKIWKEKSPGPDTVSCCGVQLLSTQQNFKNFKSLFTCPRRSPWLFTKNLDALLHWHPTRYTQVLRARRGVLNHCWDQQPRQLQR